MQRRVDRRPVLAVLAVSVLALGCVGSSVHAAARNPHAQVRSGRVAQGALLGGVAGAALGAGLDHHQRGRGAMLGGLGGLIVGAIFADQIERHDAWHRAHDAPPTFADCDHPGGHAGDCGCDGAHVWAEDDHVWDDDPYGSPSPDAHDPREHVWDDPDPAPPIAEAPAPHPLPDAPPLALPEVLFDPGEATLTRGAEARLRHLARRVRDRDDVEILLRGHSDQRETDGFDLSEARARTVRAFLAEEGVSVRRIAWVGFGAAQPVASNETAAGRQRNRRVEIVLREPGGDPYS